MSTPAAFAEMPFGTEQLDVLPHMLYSTEVPATPETVRLCAFLRTAIWTCFAPMISGVPRTSSSCLPFGSLYCAPT